MNRPMLVVVGGLPATGKTTVSRAAAGRAGAAYVRIDTIEHAISRFAARENSGEQLHHAVTWGLGYDVAYAVASDLLRQGTHVFAECVNPLKLTREAWREVAETTGADLVEVELVCSDPAEHERRATVRTVDIPDLVLPSGRGGRLMASWAAVTGREKPPNEQEYQPKTQARVRDKVDWQIGGVEEDVRWLVGSMIRTLILRLVRLVTFRRVRSAARPITPPAIITACHRRNVIIVSWAPLTRSDPCKGHRHCFPMLTIRCTPPITILRGHLERISVRDGARSNLNV